MATNRRPDQPVWSSASVAARRRQQHQLQSPDLSQPLQPSGSAASRWARPSPDPQQSSWRQPRSGAAPLPTSKAVPTGPEAAARSSASSRWATTTSSTSARPSAPATAPILSQAQAPSIPSASILLHPPSTPSRSRAPGGASPGASPIGKGGLRPRDEHRPLGGKVDRMALLASPSRGLDSAVASDLAEQGGTDLTDAATQREFRAYISTQISKRLQKSREVQLPCLRAESYLSAGPDQASTSKDGLARGNAKREEVEQIMLMVRKLREGCVSSAKLDAFTIDVYELSVYLTLLCLNIPQLASSLPRLVLDLYPTISITDCLESSPDFTALQDVERIDVAVCASQASQGAASPQPNTPPSRLSASEAVSRRAHISSLLLLQTLCLSSHASRLGQYASSTSSSSSSSPDRSLTSTLKDYASLRAVVHSSLSSQAAAVGLSTLPPDASSFLEAAEQVYRSIRDGNVFLLHRLLADKEGLTVWQRILVLQLVRPMRDLAWRTVRKAYLQVPLAVEAASLIDAQKVALRKRDAAGLASPGATNRADGDGTRWTVQVLLLGEDVLPRSLSVQREEQRAATASKPERQRRTTPPDDWDAEGSVDADSVADRLASTSLSTPMGPSVEEARRLLDFITASTSPAAIPREEIESRLEETRDGGWTLKVK